MTLLLTFPENTVTAVTSRGVEPQLAGRLADRTEVLGGLTPGEV